MIIMCALEQSHKQHRAQLDEQLIVATGQGDMEAFTALYYATDKAVMGYAFSIVKNRHDAEDVMQDTYLQIKHYAKNYKPQGKPMAWILTIVKHLSLAALKRHIHDDIDEEFDLADTNDQYQALEHSMVLTALLQNLGEEERQIVVLHAQTGLKHREIASLLDLPLATVLSKYTRAIAKLKKTAIEQGWRD